MNTMIPARGRGRTGTTGTLLLPHGFTLIELLLAIVISAVVLTAINGVLFGALRLRNRTTERLEHALPLEQAFQMFKRDIGGIVAPGGVFALNFKTGVPTGAAGSDSGLEFYTGSAGLSESLPLGNVQRVAYALRTPTNGTSIPGRELTRYVTRNLLGTVQEIEQAQGLLEGVASLEFQLYDGTQWRNSWDSTSEQPALPKAVKMVVLLSEDPGAGRPSGSRQPLEFLAPILVVAGTNQASTASQAPGGGGPQTPAPGGPGPGGGGGPRPPGGGNGGTP